MTPDPSPSMVEAVWRHIEHAGIPPSPVRDMLLELAKIIEAPRTQGDVLALASGAHMALMKVFEDHYAPRTPLEVQAEFHRTQRELRTMGVRVPEVAFTHEDFTLPPESPKELAQQLGYNDAGRAVRRVLRARFTDHPKHSRWEPLTPEQVNYVKAHLAPRS